MKLEQIFSELLEIIKKTGFVVRHDRGAFQSGYCVLNEQKIILFNKYTPLETKSAVLARCILTNEIDGIFIKPAIREFLEKERKYVELNKEIYLTTDNSNEGEKNEDDS